MASSRGALLANRGARRQAPGWVEASSSRYLKLSKNVRSLGRAESSGAIFVMTRSSGTPSAGFAPVMAAISPIVSDFAFLKNGGRFISNVGDRCQMTEIASGQLKESDLPSIRYLT